MLDVIRWNDLFQMKLCEWSSKDWNGFVCMKGIPFFFSYSGANAIEMDLNEFKWIWSNGFAESSTHSHKYIHQFEATDGIKFQ